MKLNKKRTTNEVAGRLADPEPFTITVLTSVLSGLITAGLCHVAQRAHQRFKFMQDSTENANYFEQLTDMLESAAAIVIEIREIFSGEEKYNLSAITLLPTDKIERYQEIRRRLLEAIGQVDDLIISMDLDGINEGLPTKVMSAKVRFIENHLKKAKAATLAENAFLEIESAIGAMRQLMETVRKARN